MKMKNSPGGKANPDAGGGNCPTFATADFVSSDFRRLEPASSALRADDGDATIESGEVTI